MTLSVISWRLGVIYEDMGGGEVLGSSHPPTYFYKYILPFGHIHFEIWKNRFYNLEKYVLQFGRIYFAIWTNTLFNLDKYILPFVQIHSAS